MLLFATFPHSPANISFQSEHFRVLLATIYDEVISYPHYRVDSFFVFYLVCQGLRTQGLVKPSPHLGHFQVFFAVFSIVTVLPC